MKTLIINGSTRKNGDTEALISELLRHLEGEVRIIRHADDIAPCADCRYCWDKPGCAIKDGMQEVYEYLEECDNVVLASPIWFSSLSGPTLNIASRFQTNFMARFHRHEPSPATKNGVLILTGAQPGTEENPAKNAQIIMRNMNVKAPLVAIVRSMNTDKLPAKLDTYALAACRAAAAELNRLCAQP